MVHGGSDKLSVLSSCKVSILHIFLYITLLTHPTKVALLNSPYWTHPTELILSNLLKLLNLLYQPPHFGRLGPFSSLGYYALNTLPIFKFKFISFILGSAPPSAGAQMTISRKHTQRR